MGLGSHRIDRDDSFSTNKSIFHALIAKFTALSSSPVLSAMSLCCTL